MKFKLVWIFLNMFAFPLFIEAQSGFFSSANEFFKSYVDNQGNVAYSSLARNPESLDKLVDQLASFSLSGIQPEAEKAFWINAYNISMIHAVVKHYPIQSVIDVKNVFQEPIHRVAGRSLSLDQIENTILRKNFPDARIHFVLVCGAKGCPPLANFAYTPESLEKQLNERSILCLNDSQFIRYRPESKTYSLSQIFDWYKADFLSEAASLREFINKFRTEKIPADAKTDFYTYNWKLNEKP